MRAFLPAYDLVTPSSLDDALSMLADDPELRPLAGGTDVMVNLVAGTLPRGRFLNIWSLDELRGITVSDEHITIGALTTFRGLQNHGLLASEFPMLPMAGSESGAAAIQNRGTLGGNIVNASPAADSPPALLAYDAEIELVSKDEARWIPYETFHTGYKQMDRKPNELLRAIRLPRKTELRHALHFYRKVGTRAAQAISKVVIACRIAAGSDNISYARICVGSVAPVPLRCTITEQLLHGNPVTAKLVVSARDTFAREITPIDDVRSTATYRREVAANLLEDCLIRLSHTGSNLPASIP